MSAAPKRLAPPVTLTAARNERSAGQASNERVRILLVPGFVNDTYSEIERSFVELSAQPTANIDYVWLVPDLSTWRGFFAKPGQPSVEPAYLPHLRENRVPYIVATVSKYNLFSNIALFYKIFRHHRIGAVYTHFGYERFWAVFCGRLLGRTTIWNEHWHSLGRRYARLKRIFYRLFVDEFIAVSKFLAGTLPASSKVHVLHNAINTRRRVTLRDHLKQAMCERLRIPAARKVVLMVAAFRDEKRHHIALDVCSQVFSQRTDVVFVFPGAGPLRSTFIEEVKRRGLDDRIVMPGHVDNVDEYYSVADICMLTSIREGFGYTVLEAMRYALPVVAFSTGGPAEIIEDGETGFLVAEGRTAEFAERLVMLLNDDSARKRMGEAGWSRLKADYDRESWTVRLNSVLEAVAISRVRGYPMRKTSVRRVSE